MDQAQKVMPLQRGDAALAFCGDTYVAYPFFVQASSVLNNFIRTRTRGSDVSEVATLFGDTLNNLVDSWDISLKEKREQLSKTRILFAGWSWRKLRFQIGFFKFINKKFCYQTTTNPLAKPWRERKRSLVVIGDYIEDYMRTLGDILAVTNPVTSRWVQKSVDLKYEPLEALNELLNKTRDQHEFRSIGGRPQAIKVYPYSSTLPIVTKGDDGHHYLFGRRLFDWEKTEYPVAVIAPGRTRFVYPMASIPTPANIGKPADPIRQFIQFITSRGEA
jgi:hypothetical protein